MFNVNLKNLAGAGLMAVASVSAVADNDMGDRIEAQIYQDKNFEAIKQKAITKLTKQGYHVVEVEADDYRLKPALSVEAYKNGQEYDIKLSYPDLVVLQHKLDN